MAWTGSGERQAEERLANERRLVTLNIGKRPGYAFRIRKGLAQGMKAKIPALVFQRVPLVTNHTVDMTTELRTPRACRDIDTSAYVVAVDCDYLPLTTTAI